MAVRHDVIVSDSGGGSVTRSRKRVLVLEHGDRMPREVETWDAELGWLDVSYAIAG